MATVLFVFPDELADTPTAAVGPKSLNGVPYLFRFLPNSRANDGEGAWLIDILAADGEALDVGRKLIETSDMYAEIKDDDSRLPQGQVVVRRVEGDAGDPLLTELGTSVVVEYVEVES